VVAVPALKPTGKLVMAANATDVDPVGGPLYRTVLHLLSLYGAERFNQLLLSPDWSFIPEQWQVQMWARVFSKIPMDNFTYCFPHVSPETGRFSPERMVTAFFRQNSDIQEILEASQLWWNLQWTIVCGSMRSRE